MKEKLKTMFTKNLGTKLLSVVIAGLVWVVIMSVSDPQVTRTIENIPVERRNEDAVSAENMVYEALSGNLVTIKVRGSRSIVETLDVKDFTAYVDFQEIGWVNAVPIHVEVNNPEYEDLTEITYQSNDVMSILLVEYQEDMVMVDVKTTNVPDGYYAFCSSVSSKLLEISGSKTQVESVEKLVGTVDLTGRTESFQTTVTLEPVNIDGTPIDATKLNIAQNYVRVDITILPVKEVPIALDTSGVTLAEGFGIASIDYSPKTVQIAAEQEVLDTLNEITIPYAADSLMQSEEVDIEIAKYLPEGVYLKSETTTLVLSISVELLVRKEFSLALPSDLIEIRNLGENFELNYTQNVLSLPVYGVSGVLDNMQIKDLHLYLDMATCTSPGSYSAVLRSDSELGVSFSQKVSVYITEKGKN
ncbi:MAG: CdaR family protein [Lachnospiraceae bacterium]|nr:CdaR family protein [Lachnospiraceae bacterium]